MSARNDETWLFVVEWFDPMPRLKRSYLLRYFVQQHQVEMVDLKSKKMFLKKSPCTEDTTPQDFAIGKKILLFSRELDIVDYGDTLTKQKLQQYHQPALIILGSSTYDKWGLILDDLNDLLIVVSIKSIFPSPDISDIIMDIAYSGTENNGNRNRNPSVISKGVCLVLLLSGADAVDILSDYVHRNNHFGPESVIIGSSSNKVNDLKDFIFGFSLNEGNDGRSSSQSLAVSAILDSCTCCIVKPHSFKAKHTGRILDRIIKSGFEVSAVCSLSFDRVQAEEFLEVYKVVQLCSGVCVAFEVRAVDAVALFRETAGPWEVSMAKELRPNSIRGMFGESNVRSAVYCTDLASDGVTDCEYCFQFMQ